MDRLTRTLLHVYAAAFIFLIARFALAGPMTGWLVMVLAVDAMMLTLISYGAFAIIANTLSFVFGLGRMGHVVEVIVGIAGATIAFIALSYPYPTVALVVASGFAQALKAALLVTGITMILQIATGSLRLRSLAGGFLPSFKRGHD